MKLTTGQRIVLSQHFSEYPDNLHFDDICEMIRNNDHENIVIWEPFEEWDINYFIRHITELSEKIDSIKR